MTTKTDAIRNTVDKWFQETIANSHIARNTEAYNQAFGAKDELVKRLSAALEADGVQTAAALNQTKPVETAVQPKPIVETK